jgi:O-antigen/teichoic acid export membrane protein
VSDREDVSAGYPSAGFLMSAPASGIEPEHHAPEIAEQAPSSTGYSQSFDGTPGAEAFSPTYTNYSPATGATSGPPEGAASPILPSDSDVALQVESERATEVDVSSKRVVRGTASLIAREGLLKVFVVAANIVLARVLAPREFGIFVILTFFNSFLVTFGAFGLGPSITQRKAPPTEGELASLFTIQVVIAAVFILATELLAPTLSGLYHLGTSGIWLIRAMALGFLFTSAGATPMALLERRLAFGRVAIVEVLVGGLFQSIAVIMALTGFGVWSLVVATLVSNGFAAVATFLSSGWWPHFSLRWRGVLPMVWFGMQFQTQSIISLFKDNITATFVAAFAGAAAVGYINWATTIAFYPLMFIILIRRVVFPVYARVADDKAVLQRMIESTIRTQCYLIFPIVAAIAAFAPFIAHDVYTDKWLPAVPLLYFLLIPTVLTGLSQALVIALSAMGKPAVVTGFMVMWLVLEWATTVPFVLWLGYLGFAVANACVSATVIVVVLIFKRYQPVRMWHSIGVPLASATIAGVVFLLFSRAVPPTTVPLLAAQAFGLLVLFAMLEVVLDRRFVADVKTLWQAQVARFAAK